MKTLLISVLCFMSLNLLAQELKVEPLYSFEKTYRIEPEPARYVTRTYLGVRATYGVPILAGEFEVAQSTDSDTFPADNREVDYKTYRAMLGLRTSPFRTQYVGAYFRAGIRAKKEERTIKENNVTTTEEDGIIIDPYAGAGVTVGISDFFALNAGATLVYNRNAPSGKKFDQQVNLSFSFKAGNR